MKFEVAHIGKLICLMALGAHVAACGARGTPEEQVRATLAAAESAAEARDVSNVMALVADDYSDDNGYDRARLRDFVRGYFALNPTLEIVMRIESIEFPATDLARARLSVATLGAGGGGALGLSADGERFDVELVRASDAWRLRYARRARE